MRQTLAFCISIPCCRQQDKTYVFYESTNPKAEIVRVAWNKLDGRYIAAIHAESHFVHILDLRWPK